MTIKFEARMEENERCLEAVHHLEEALDKDLHNSVIESQNKNLTDEQIHNILDDLRFATERFTEAEKKPQETSTNNEIFGGTVVDTKSLRSGGSRQSETRDTIFLKRLADMELKTKSTLWKLNRIHEHKSNKIVALERIEASIKKNMRRL